MAKITITIESASGASSISTPDIPEAKFRRIVNHWWRNHPQFDADGKIVPRTPQAEVASFREWFMAIVFGGLKRNVIAEEKELAARAAKNAVSDLE